MPRPADGQLVISLRVLNGAGGTLELHTAAGRAWSQAIEGEDISLTAVVDVSSTPYVRAQLVQQAEQMPLVRALTNPIYIR